MHQQNRNFNKYWFCCSDYAQTKWRPLQIWSDTCKDILRTLISCSQTRLTHECRAYREIDFQFVTFHSFNDSVQI